MSNPGPYRYEQTVVVASDKTTTRGGYYDTEGGALNGNYTDFDVGCIVSNDLGRQGYTYGQDFYFEDAGCDEVCFSFKDPKLVTYMATKYTTKTREESIHG